MIIIYDERHYSECISSLAKTSRYARKRANSDRIIGNISRNYESSNQSIGERVVDIVCNGIGDGLDYYVDIPSNMTLTDIIVPIKDDTADKRDTKKSVKSEINKILNKFGIRDKR
jgi:hypothetical protein